MQPLPVREEDKRVFVVGAKNPKVTSTQVFFLIVNVCFAFHF